MKTTDTRTNGVIFAELEDAHREISDLRAELATRQQVIDAIMVKLDAIEVGVRLLTTELTEARDAARKCAGLLRLLHSSGVIDIGRDCETIWESLATVEKWGGK